MGSTVKGLFGGGSTKAQERMLREQQEQVKADRAKIEAREKSLLELGSSKRGLLAFLDDAGTTTGMLGGAVESPGLEDVVSGVAGIFGGRKRKASLFDKTVDKFGGPLLKAFR
jgi:hypothetical protein